jgi:hypothetical protein
VCGGGRVRRECALLLHTLPRLCYYSAMRVCTCMQVTTLRHSPHHPLLTPHTHNQPHAKQHAARNVQFGEAR